MGAAVGCGSPLQGECLEGFDFLGLHHIKTHYTDRQYLETRKLRLCFSVFLYGSVAKRLMQHLHTVPIVSLSLT